MAQSLAIEEEVKSMRIMIPREIRIKYDIKEGDELELIFVRANNTELKMRTICRVISEGRIIIPDAIRRNYGIENGDEIELILIRIIKSKKPKIYILTADEK